MNKHMLGKVVLVLGLALSVLVVSGASPAEGLTLSEKWCYDAPAAGFGTFTHAPSPTAFDVDGNGYLGIFIGGGDFLCAINQDGSERWTVQVGSIMNDYDEVLSIPTVADLNGDGREEIIFGACRTVFVYGEAGDPVWQFFEPGEFDCPLGSYCFYASAVADLSGDSDLEIIASSAYTGNIYCFDGDPSDGVDEGYPDNGDGRYDILWVYDTSSPTTGEGIYSPAVIGDVNNDGELEVIVSSAGGLRGNNKVYCLKGSDGTLVWKSPELSLGVFSSPALANPALDNSAVSEWYILAGNADYHFDPDDGFLYALGGNDGRIIWQYNIGDKVTSSPVVGDLNNDGELEVIVGSDKGFVYSFDVYDPASPIAPQYVFNGSMAGAHVASSPVIFSSIQNSSNKLVAIGSKSNVGEGPYENFLYVLDHQLNEVSRFPVWAGSNSTPAVADIDNDGTVELLSDGYNHDTNSGCVYALESSERISIISPNGGEFCPEIPGEVEISWFCDASIPPGAEIALYYAHPDDGRPDPANPADWTFIEGGLPLTPSSYIWTLPTEFFNNSDVYFWNFYLKVRVTDGAGLNLADISDGPFTLGDGSYYLNMTAMPWTANDDSEAHYSTGVAVCKMILDYIRAPILTLLPPVCNNCPGPPAWDQELTQEEMWKHIRYSGPAYYFLWYRRGGFNDFTPGEMAAVLGYFDPYDYLISSPYESLDDFYGYLLSPAYKIKEGNYMEGYLFSPHRYKPEKMNDYLRDICHWMDYEVTEHADSETLVARPQTPAAVPIYGDTEGYEHWVAVKGFATSADPCPYPRTNPAYIPDFEIYGFWMKDPRVDGIGDNVYATADECRDNYFKPIKYYPWDDGRDGCYIWSRSYSGKLVQIAEPPVSCAGIESNAKVKIKEPELDLANLEFVGVPLSSTQLDLLRKNSFLQRAGAVSRESSGASLLPRKPKESWRDLVDEYFLRDEEAVAAFSGTEMGEALFVKRLDRGRDYYLVPFGKQGKVKFAAIGIMLLDAEEGYFREATWAEEAREYLPVDKQEALKLIRDYLRESGEKKLLRYVNEGQDGPEAKLVWEPAGSSALEIYSASPYQPYWKIKLKVGGTWYVTQGREILREKAGETESGY